MNEDTNNTYLLSILIEDQYSTLLENIKSNLTNSAITTNILDQTVVQNIINLNAIDIRAVEIVKLNTNNHIYKKIFLVKY